ncbi:MAG: ABC transporter ATP-binding protein [Chloroflexota bacterium]|nr:ABC transporter ATP-binding protein [Chloroflexota bacterium]
MICLRGVSKSYRQGDSDVVAVDNVNVDMAAGDFAIIAGRSGSGKTTLLSLIGGLTHPSAGTICVDGMNLLSLDDKTLSNLRARRIGFIFQFASFLPTLTVLENVCLPRLFAGEPAKSNRAIAKHPVGIELLQMVGLDDKANNYPTQLSGGQRRRAAIARAFINQPALLLADEPTGDLDIDTESEILELFRSLNRQGTTILLVTHNPGLATIGNRLFQMERGRLVESHQKAKTR